MDYFLLKQSNQIAWNQNEISQSKEATLCKLDDITQFKGIDYLSKENLISDRLKLILESFLPKNIWKPYVFMDMKKEKQEIFWNLEAEIYLPDKLELNSIGYPHRMQIDVEKIPRIFRIVQKKGMVFIFLHLSVAESMLRRGILGLDYIPISIFF